jgi:hypothetical protein
VMTLRRFTARWSTPLSRSSPSVLSPSRRLKIGDRRLVCTENSVRVDYVTESPNLSGDDRSVLPLPGPIRLAAQVEEPT